MAAQLITSIKNINPDGSILEIVIWKVPKPVPPTEHGYKYRTVYVVDGVRIVGFDNERGKGDHCHIDGIGKLLFVLWALQPRQIHTKAKC